MCEALPGVSETAVVLLIERPLERRHHVPGTTMSVLLTLMRPFAGSTQFGFFSHVLRSVTTNCAVGMCATHSC